MDLVITLRKEVPDEQTAEQILTIVKSRLEDYPDVVVAAHTSKRLTDNPE